MSLRINDSAPDFLAKTTEGDLSFHEWIGDSWAVDTPEDLEIVIALMKERNEKV